MEYNPAMQPIKFPGCSEAIIALEKVGMTQEEIKQATTISQGGLSNLKTKRRTSVNLEKGLLLVALYADRVLGKRVAFVRK